MGSRLPESQIRGVTLIELLVVASIVAVVMFSLVPHITTGRQVWEIVGDRHAEVMQNSRIGLDKMVREIRQVQSIIDAGSDYIEFVDRDDNDMRFEYDSAVSAYLEYGSPGSLNSLSGPINSLSMIYYEEDGATPTTTPEDIRSVQIQMTTFDSEGKVSDITLSSRVLIRKSISTDNPILELFVYSVGDLKTEGYATIIGDIGSSGEIELKDYSVVNGNAVVADAGDITIGDDATLNGEIIINPVALPAATSFSHGSTSITVDNSDHTTLSPGSYRDLTMRDQATLTLQAGDYYFRRIDINNDSILDFPSNGNVRIFVTGHVFLSNDSRVAIDGSVVDAGSDIAREKSKEIFVEVQDKFEMKNSSQWIGIVFASSTNANKESKLDGSSVKFTGAFYSGHRIRIKDATAEFITPNSDILPPQFLQ